MKYVILFCVSKKVKNQYEENPYPRWRYTYEILHSNFLFKLTKISCNERSKPCGNSESATDRVLNNCELHSQHYRE